MLQIQNKQWLFRSGCTHVERKKVKIWDQSPVLAKDHRIQIFFSLSLPPTQMHFKYLRTATFFALPVSSQWSHLRHLMFLKTSLAASAINPLCGFLAQLFGILPKNLLQPGNVLSSNLLLPLFRSFITFSNSSFLQSEDGSFHNSASH